MNNSELLPDPNAPAAYNKETGKIKALQHLIIEIRDVNVRIMKDGHFGGTARYWHLQGFAEGVVESMQTNDTPPNGCVSWLKYVVDRLEFFESTFANGKSNSLR